MKSKSLLINRSAIALLGFIFCSFLLIGSSVSAQNLLGNPGFESPLGVGTTNWTVAYVVGGPDDFEVKDRTTVADRHRSQLGNARGAHLRPSNDKPEHAYFTQTVRNLELGHSYTITGWLRWEGGTASGFGNAALRYRVYFDAIGGQAPARSPDVPDDGVDDWHQYTVTQTPDAEGKIEVRLHLDRFSWAEYGKLVKINAYFDDFSLTR